MFGIRVFILKFVELSELSFCFNGFVILMILFWILLCYIEKIMYDIFLGFLWYFEFMINVCERLIVYMSISIFLSVIICMFV